MRGEHHGGRNVLALRASELTEYMLSDVLAILNLFTYVPRSFELSKDTDFPLCSHRRISRPMSNDLFVS